MPRKHSATCFATLCAVVVLAFSAQAEDQRPSQDAGPRFFSGGLDSEAYGAGLNFPVGPLPVASRIDHLVGTYSHFDSLVPSRLVRRAATPWLFERVAEPAIRYRYKSEPHRIEDYLARNPVTGLMIARDNVILYEHYQYDRTDRDRLLSQSMAKTITAMLVGIAVSENKIKSIDDTASAYVPALGDSEYGKTSIRDLLHMSSGVSFVEEYNGSDDITKLSRDLFGQPAKEAAAAVVSFNTRISPPATKWRYSSAETEVLGLVLRNATGVPLADYLQDKIWSAIGSEADASWTIDGNGQEVAYCCFNAVLRDYARLGRLLAHDGNWNGQQVIPRQWIMDATTVSADAGFLAPGIASPYFGYGYQVWLFPGEARRFVLLGIRGQMIFVDPVSKLVMVHTAVRKRPSDPDDYPEVMALWFGVLAQLGK